MKAWVSFAIALVILGCGHRDEAARELLTTAQQQRSAGDVAGALSNFKRVAEEYPGTTAATDALEFARPLSVQLDAAVAACGQFFLDVGADPRDVEDLEREPPGLAPGTWTGPYASRRAMGAFGEIVVRGGCVAP